MWTLVCQYNNLEVEWSCTCLMFKIYDCSYRSYLSLPWFLVNIHYTGAVLSGSPAKSGPLDFGTKNNFRSFFGREKGLTHIHKKAIYYFPVSYFCFATSQNCILAELRLPTVIRKVKFTDFVKRATSPKMQHRWYLVQIKWQDVMVSMATVGLLKYSNKTIAEQGYLGC